MKFRKRSARSPGLNPLVISQPVTGRLQEMITAIQPSFSQGLVHLNSLFDLVMNYDDQINSGLKDDATTSSIKTAIQMAFDSISETDKISAHHMELYQANLVSLTSDITDKENLLRNHEAELARLTAERARWQSEAERLQAEIADLDAKVRHADELAQRAQQRVVKKRRNRWKWIAATVVTGGKLQILDLVRYNFTHTYMIFFRTGLAAPGLIINERDLQRIKNERNSHQASAHERRQVLQVAENNLQDIANRQQASEQSINSTRNSLSSAQSTLDQLRKQFPTLNELGVQIKTIASFLVQFNSEMSLMNDHQQLMVLLRPLLNSIESLINFLESNANMVILLSDKDAITKIRGHLLLNVSKSLEP